MSLLLQKDGLIITSTARRNGGNGYPYYTDVDSTPQLINVRGFNVFCDGPVSDVAFLITHYSDQSPTDKVGVVAKSLKKRLLNNKSHDTTLLLITPQQRYVVTSSGIECVTRVNWVAGSTVSPREIALTVDLPGGTLLKRVHDATSIPGSFYLFDFVNKGWINAPTCDYIFWDRLANIQQKYGTKFNLQHFAITLGDQIAANNNDNLPYYEYHFS